MSVSRTASVGTLAPGTIVNIPSETHPTYRITEVETGIGKVGCEAVVDYKGSWRECAQVLSRVPNKQAFVILCYDTIVNVMEDVTPD